MHTPRQPALFSMNKGILVVLFFITVVFAQFGKNKVQYESLNWRYLKTPHLSVYFHQDCSDMPSIAAAWTENAYTSLSHDFGFTHKKAVPLLLYGSPNLFQQTNVSSDLIPEGVGGFTEHFKNRIAVPFTGSYGDFRHVLHHELVHAFEFGILYQNMGGALLRGSGAQMPLWFAEGLAEYLSSGWDTEADMFLMDQAVFGSIPPPGPALDGYMAYKGGQSFFHFLESSLGDSLFSRFEHAFRDTRRVDASIEKTYRISLEKLGREWQRQLKRIYWPEIGRRQVPEQSATNLTGEPATRTHFNLMPRIAPNGNRVAYFSDLKDYTKIIIADTSGDIVDEISQTGYGGYFESFHPFRSGLAWSPGSDQLAFVTKSSGQDEIRIVDIEKKKLIRSISFKTFRLIANPDWSPRGDKLVFAALEGDRSDLYLFTLADSSLIRLTNSIEYEDFPRFSPDGTRIVFSCEDTSGCALTVADSVERPTFDLAVLSLDNGSVRRLDSTNWNEKQAIFTADGNHVVFVSDRNGIDNLYIAPLDSIAHARPITDVIGGISSPDLAKDDSVLVYTLFQKGRWDVYLMHSPADSARDKPLEPTVWMQSRHDSNIAFFKPFKYEPEDDSSEAVGIFEKAEKDPKKRNLTESAIAEIQPDTVSADSAELSIGTLDTVASIFKSDTEDSANQTPETVVSDTVIPAPSDTSNAIFPALSASMGIAADDTTYVPRLSFPRVSYPYRLVFSPDMVTFGMGISPSYGYGGTWLVALSDLMGDHRFTFAGDVQGRIQEYSHFFGSYFISKYRTDFGLGLFYSRDYTWFLTKGSNQRESDTGSTRWFYYHDTDYGGSFLIRYPFSLSARADLGLYASHVDRRQKPTGPVVRSFDILIPTMSFVYDDILWGITGPINGIRAKLAVTAIPPLKTVDASYVSADFDFRKYIHIAKRFVLALRGTAGGVVDLQESDVNRRYFLGGSENWLAADVNIKNAENNIHNIFYSDFVVPFRGWNYFDLTGSRYAVVNTEFRFPFVREISLAWPLPVTIQYINGAVFMDAGNAWNQEDQRDNIPIPSTIYGGIGFGMRVNLGIFVLRYDRAWKTDWQQYVKTPVTYFSLGADF